MPFGLKNAGATYQRCMLKCFSDLIGETIEAYMDDIIVKSKKVDQLVVDLEKTFKKLQENGIKLNPKNAFSRSREVCCLGLSSLSVTSKPT
jgi:hypothetical protein